VRDGRREVDVPERSRRTLDWITSTPHFSQTIPRLLMRLYCRIALVVLHWPQRSSRKTDLASGLNVRC